MLRIHKYKITWDQSTRICQIPLTTSATILSVANQSGYLCMWVLLDPEDTKIVDRTFYIGITGLRIPFPEDHLRFIGTVLFDLDSYVLHIFEVIEM